MYSNQFVFWALVFMLVCMTLLMAQLTEVQKRMDRLTRTVHQCMRQEDFYDLFESHWTEAHQNVST